LEHFLQHPWYYFKEYEIMQLISGLLTVALTVFAMWWIDKRAAKRWINEGYIKRKIELEIEIRKVLLEIKQEIIKKNLRDANQDYMNNFYNELLRTLSSYWKNNKINILIDEYTIYNTNSAYYLKSLKEKYNAFTKDTKPTPVERYQNLTNQIFSTIESLEEEIKSQ
jgi:hypothetical protein